MAIGVDQFGKPEGWGAEEVGTGKGWDLDEESLMGKGGMFKVL